MRIYKVIKSLGYKLLFIIFFLEFRRKFSKILFWYLTYIFEVIRIFYEKRRKKVFESSFVFSAIFRFISSFFYNQKKKLNPGLNKKLREARKPAELD